MHTHMHINTNTNIFFSFVFIFVTTVIFAIMLEPYLLIYTYISVCVRAHSYICTYKYVRASMYDLCVYKLYV